MDYLIINIIRGNFFLEVFVWVIFRFSAVG